MTFSDSELAALKHILRCAREREREYNEIDPKLAEASRFYQGLMVGTSTGIRDVANVLEDFLEEYRQRKTGDPTMSTNNLELGTKLAKRFTRATLVDKRGTVIGATLCDLRYLPKAGLQPFDEFKILVEQDSEGDCTLILDQDPPTDWHFSYALGTFHTEDTVTVECSETSGIVRASGRWCVAGHRRLGDPMTT